MMTILTIIAIGLTTGILSGLLGIGGGVVMVPMLVLFLGLEQHLAQGISMLVIIPTSVVAIWQLHKSRLVDYRMAAYLAAGAVAGALLSANFVQYIPAAYLKKIFGVFVMYAGARMIFAGKKPADSDA